MSARFLNQTSPRSTRAAAVATTAGFSPTAKSGPTTTQTAALLRSMNRSCGSGGASGT